MSGICSTPTHSTMSVRDILVNMIVLVSPALTCFFFDDRNVKPEMQNVEIELLATTDNPSVLSFRNFVRQ